MLRIKEIHTKTQLASPVEILSRYEMFYRNICVFEN